MYDLRWCCRAMSRRSSIWQMYSMYSIILNGSVCQAFDYNTDTKLAFFKGQPPTLPINYMTAACVFPNVTLGVLSSGERDALRTAMCSNKQPKHTCVTLLPSCMTFD